MVYLLSTRLSSNSVSSSAIDTDLALVSDSDTGSDRCPVTIFFILGQPYV